MFIWQILRFSLFKHVSNNGRMLSCATPCESLYINTPHSRPSGTGVWQRIYREPNDTTGAQDLLTGLMLQYGTDWALSIRRPTHLSSTLAKRGRLLRFEFLQRVWTQLSSQFFGSMHGSREPSWRQPGCIAAKGSNLNPKMKKLH